MSLQARYDPQSDRMRLMLQPAQGAPRVFWVTRRQWLGWLHALLRLPPSREAAGATSEGAPPKPRRPRAAADQGIEPQALSAIRLRRAGERVQVVFAIEGEAAAQGTTMMLPPEGVARMRDLLQQQAERAGWDPGAALARLNATAMAGAALRKASRAE
jgi:hypothetical protein